MRACFLFPFQNEYDQNAGTCWSKLFLTHFTTLFRMVTKFRNTDIVSLASPRGILELPSAVFSVCQNHYQMLVFCWHVFWQMHKFQIHKLVSRRDHLNISTMYSVIIQAGIFREYWNKCFWRTKCFGSGTSSVYGIADNRRERRSSDYAFSEIKREMPFSPSVLHA